MANKTDLKRWVVVSTWGQHYVEAENEYWAEEEAEKELRQQGYTKAQAEVMINDGMTEEYDPKYHGEWSGDE